MSVAPRAGQISEASVRAGQYLTAGSHLIFLVSDKLWAGQFQGRPDLELAYRATGELHRGRLPGKKLSGKIEEIAPVTGSKFSAPRPDNASGNFIKVAQRLPIRIAIDPDQPLALR